MKISKTRLKQIITEEASKILNEVITVRDIERMLPSGVMAEYPGAANILQRRALAAKMSRDELVQKIKAAKIKDNEHPRQFFRRLGFEYDLREEHETVYADAGGIAERKIKKKHDIGDKAIKSTKEGKCKR